jgi:hypothetical protein
VAQNLASASVSRASAAVRRSFVERGELGEPSPLKSLLSGINGPGGGAGGRLRIALLITLLWVVAQPPHTTRRVASWWAALLGLNEPTGSGARAVRDTLHELEARGFVTLTRIGNDSNEISLLNEDGSRRSYTFPAPADGEPYFRVPRLVWDEQWISRLTGRALAIYLIVLSNSGWRDEGDFWISASLFEERYGLGETTRKRGFRELVDLGILEVTAESVTRREGTRTFRRNIYRLTNAFRSTPPTPSEQSTG